jgi:hypothetical protein
MVEQFFAAIFGALKSHARTSLAGLALHLAAAGLFLLGGLYLSFAVYLALAEQLGPPVAAAVTGGLLMLLGILVMLIALLITRHPHRRAGEVDTVDLVHSLVRAGELFGHKAGRPSTSLAVTALLAGLVAGLSPATREFLLNLADQLFKDLKGEPK